MTLFKTLLAVLLLVVLSCGDTSPQSGEPVESTSDKLSVGAGFANLALGRPTRQSSTVAEGTSDRAVNGNYDGNWYNGGVTHTNLDTEAWWEVDLGSTRYIEAVRVFGRTDCCQDRLSHYWLYISETPITSNNPFGIAPASGYWPQFFAAERWTNGVPDTVVMPEARKRGRYVRIYVPGPQMLSLAEVEVWGAVNLAPARTFYATQSSTPMGAQGIAWLAADDNPDGYWGSGYTVTHTGQDNRAWWQIDLGSVQSIKAVDLWNRIDCCSDRLSNVWVMASEAPFASTDLITTLFQPGVVAQKFTGQVPALVPGTVNLDATGRYVRVQLESTSQILSLAEVRIWGLPRLGGTAVQSSTGWDGVAQRALDGNHNGNWSGNSVTHTGLESYPMWVGTFPQKSSIGLTRVWNRTDSEGQRLNDFRFFSASGGTYVHPGAAGEVTNIWSMSIQNPNDYYPTISTLLAPTTDVGVFIPRTDYLSLAEVEMFGQPVAQCGLANGHCCPEGTGQPCSGGRVCKYNVCRAIDWPASWDYTDRAGNPANPTDWAEQWTNDLQGVAHSATDWYFTNMHFIMKIPLGDDITNHGGDWWSLGQLFPASYYHYGDLSYYRNVSTWADPIGHEALVVPIETLEEPPYIRYVAIINPELTWWAYWELPTRGSLAWLAVNPADGLVYMPESYDGLSQVSAWRIQWPTNGTPFALTHVKTINLHNSNGAMSLSRVQGGEFSANGHLYLVSWDCYNSANGGVYGFDTDGTFMMHHEVIYSPNECGGLEDELEGIDVVDLDSTNPSYGGQLHIIKVDNEWPNDDSFHFMHVKVPPAQKYRL